VPYVEQEMLSLPEHPSSSPPSFKWIHVVLSLFFYACFIECGLAKVDLVIILDSSTSVGDDNYLKMKNFCKDFLKNADLDSVLPYLYGISSIASIISCVVL
jgi:hypothetical protein